MSDVTVTVRTPDELAKVLLWANKNEYKAHITHCVPSQVPDFEGDPVFEPWFEVKLEDRSTRAMEIKSIVEEFAKSRGKS